jgi:hypothetical protein
MSLVVAATGLGGFLTSFTLLHMGMNSLALRYALAVATAYMVFITVVWLWLLSLRRTFSIEIDPVDAIDALTTDLPSSSPDLSPSHFSGGGGQFGGGGASSSFSSDMPPTTSTSSGGGGIGFDFDFDEGVFILAVAAAVCSAMIAAIYLVMIAPGFFAEAFLDSMLSVGLYRRLRRIQAEHWLSGVVRKTILPFITTLIFFTVAGLAIHGYAPDAVSIGDAWKYYWSLHP